MILTVTCWLPVRSTGGPSVGTGTAVGVALPVGPGCPQPASSRAVRHTSSSASHRLLCMRHPLYLSGSWGECFPGNRLPALDAKQVRLIVEADQPPCWLFALLIENISGPVGDSGGRRAKMQPSQRRQ